MTLEPIRILLVEDNDGDARLLAEYLREVESLPTTLVRADRFSRAQEYLSDASSPPELILLDLSLPDARGIGTVTRALEAAPETPIIVLTGLDDEEIAVQAVHAGAQDYLVKGRVEPVLLARAIRYALERHRLERERRRALAEEQAARSRAEAAVKARDQVLRVVSHDFDNHLSAIRISAAVLSRVLPDESAFRVARERVDGIADQVEQLRRLRRDLLDSSAIEAGRLSLDPAPLDPGAFLAEAHEQMLPIATEKGVDLVLHPAEEVLPAISADRLRLLQTLGNLVGNAIKFTPAGGCVVVQGSRVEGGICITVDDTGPGVLPEHLPHVFDSFWYQRMDNPNGAGLGLGIARGIVEAHGGRIWMESRVREGSSVKFVLPLAMDPAENNEAAGD
ncbi:MAG: response regulator [Gemmatimonadota bacterium]|jgi:signal transduction histidine kinase|nr:response regulator [Gemmatimonadota bacterium]